MLFSILAKGIEYIIFFILFISTTTMNFNNIHKIEAKASIKFDNEKVSTI
jgi:hypothetical protein